MRLVIFTFSILFSINCYSHKNRVVAENYGNVKVYMRTGFDYSDIYKTKIVGQLAEKLSNRLQYKDTVFIEYIQDYAKEYSDDLYLLEYNNSNFKIIGGIKSDYKTPSNGHGLSIRIYTDRIDIVNVLKLIEFTINNREKTNSFLTKKSIEYNVYEYRELLGPLTSLATNDEVINQIFASDSELINEFIKEKILIAGQENYGIEIYWQNDKFIFEYNHIWSDEQEFVFELKDYFYHLYVNANEILIFVDKNSFYFLNGTSSLEKELIKIENESHAPLIVMSYGNKLLFHPFRDKDNLSIFLKDKNKVISKFE